MQHLNLYDQLDRAVEPIFSARQQVMLVVVVSVVMLTTYAVLLFSKASRADELELAQQQQQVVAAELDKLKAKKARLERDNDLERELTLLKNNIKFRRRLLASIDPDDQLMESGFSEHLQGLARQNIKGMWFTEIQLKAGGRELALLGETRAPEYVPRFVQNLAQEQVFVGHQFRVLRLSTPEKNNRLIEFELRAKEIE